MKTLVRVRFILFPGLSGAHSIKMELALPLPERLAVKVKATEEVRFFRRAFVVIDCIKEVKFWWETGETIYKEVPYDRFGVENHSTFLVE